MSCGSCLFKLFHPICKLHLAYRRKGKDIGSGMLKYVVFTLALSWYGGKACSRDSDLHSKPNEDQVKNGSPTFLSVVISTKFQRYRVRSILLLLLTYSASLFQQS